MRGRAGLAAIGGAALVAAAAAGGTPFRAAVEQAWPPFVLVAGLLALGAVLHAAGLFTAVGQRLAAVRGPHVGALVLMLLLVAATTAVLNLDTAAAFLTPVAVVAAERRGLRPEAFLYGTLFMTNAASLLLPGSNLTNLLVVGGRGTSGLRFAETMWPAFAASVTVTVLVVVWWRRHDLRGSARGGGPGPGRVAGWAVATVAAVGALIVLAPAPALPVLALAAAVSAAAVRAGRAAWRPVLAAVDPLVLSGLFGLAVGLGTVARAATGPSGLLGTLNPAAVATVAAGATVVLNNLPAAALLTAGHVAHPSALLLGLDLGPNLAVTGSLSALVWLKVARVAGGDPDWRRVSRVGVVLVPLTLAASLLALAACSPPLR